ncbi:MAG: AI-2E family transporter, partial [Planctomycetaceae bacterium]|nr:AI-2E family transporter [Planctomycetaceae bacterium]
ELMPTLTDKRGLVTMIRSVEHGISQYLVTITAINIGLGIIIGTVMWLLGLPDPVLLGIMAATLNFIPFVGAFIGAAVTFLIGIVYLNTPAEAVIGPLMYIVINTLEGNVITPMILGRSMKLNPALVFICIIFWGWAWGVGGILLAVPLIGMVKISCDDFESLQPVARILSG